MALTDKLKEVIVDDLKNMNLLFLDVYARNNGSTLKSLYLAGIIDDDLLEKALEDAVYNQARRDYETMEKSSFSSHADHVARPDCLGYAIMNGKFSDNELSKIPFDHGETIESFPKIHGSDNLLEKLKDQLFNPKPSIKYKISHCC